MRCTVPEFEEVGDAVDLVEVRVVQEDDGLGRQVEALLHRHQVVRVKRLDAVKLQEVLQQVRKNRSMFCAVSHCLSRIEERDSSRFLCVPQNPATRT